MRLHSERCRSFQPWPAGLRAGSLAILAFLSIVQAEAQVPGAQQQLALDIFRELIEIDTVTQTGDTLQAANAVAARLRAAGFTGSDVQVLSPAPRKGNLVARLRGTGKRKPILLLAHLDVVPARREDWSTDPFKLVEREGYFYARGTVDNKFNAATFVANLIRYRQEGYRPDRDIIVVLEADEENLDSDKMGIQWLLQHHRPLIDAEFALNEGGALRLRNGKPFVHTVQVSEKLSVSYRLEVKNPGGHSSVPRPDNAIYRLATGLSKLAAFVFPHKLNETSRAYFQRTAEIESEETAADMRSILSGAPDAAALSIVRLSRNPIFNAALRTTCVATTLEAGEAINALPQFARAGINCRVMPGEPLKELEATLRQVLDDDQISISQIQVGAVSEPSPLHEEIVGTIEKLSAEYWPQAKVVPVMAPFATDGTFLRNAGIPTYGHSGMSGELEDFRRAHGRDERLPVNGFHVGMEYMYRLVKALSGGT